MSDLVEKLRPVERDLAAETGEFALFALFHDEENPHERWDLVVAAPSLDANRYWKHLKRIVAVLRDHLSFEDFLRVSGILIVPVSHPDVVAALRRFPAEDRVVEICHRELFGRYIDEGYIMTARAALAGEPQVVGGETALCTPSRAAV